jgi:hypothetical protein
MWSPDSRQIAFFVGNKLKKVPASGGPAQTICEADGADGSWSSRGEIIFDGSTSDPLLRVSASGGIPKPVVEVAEVEGRTSVGWPEFLPDGKRFLYISEVGAEGSTIMLRDLESNDEVPLAPADSRVQYADPGFLLYVLDGMLVAHPFDAGSGELTGEPVPLADNIGSTAVGLADFSAAADGTLAYRSGESGGRQLRWFDRSGRAMGDLTEPDEYRSYRLSPDGGRIAAQIFDPDAGQSDVWIHDLERGVSSRFTFDPGADYAPLWDARGASVVYTNRVDDRYRLMRKDASGAGAPETLLEYEQRNIFAGDVTRDGRFLAFMVEEPETGWDIWATSADGSAEPFPLVKSEFLEVRPTFSPDGRWYAYESSESGQPEVYVRQFPGPGGQWQVSTDGGTEPMWSADGTEIFYVDSGGNLVSVAVDVEGSFKAGIPEKLFGPPLFPTIQRERYVVSGDGQQFLVLATPSGEAVRPTTVVLEWHAGLDD